MQDETTRELQAFKALKDKIRYEIELFEASTDWIADKQSLQAVMDYVDDAFYTDMKRASEPHVRCHKDSQSFNDAREG